VRALLSGAPIRVHGDGEQSRSNTFVSDVVRCALSAWERPAASIGQTFNLGGGEVVTVNRALDLLEELVGARAERVSAPSRPGDQRHTHADFSKAGRLLDYRPGVTLRDGLAAQVAWQRR
jgi:nucleoside-diphosphate-sugar epimerase